MVFELDRILIENQTLRDERDRYKDVLEMIADGPGTNGYCTQYERYMIELAQAALTPAGGQQGEGRNEK